MRSTPPAHYKIFAYTEKEREEKRVDMYTSLAREETEEIYIICTLKSSLAQRRTGGGGDIYAACTEQNFRLHREERYVR